MDDYNIDDYFGGNTKDMFTSDSPFLLSSSPWLNDPRVREYVAKHSLRRNHKDVPATVDITDIMPVLHEGWPKRIPLIEHMFVEERKKNEVLDAWFEEGFLSSLNPETLKDYPFDSVGNLLLRFVTANGYLAEFAPEMKSNTQFEYFQKRLSQQHDLEHILGGFGFEYIGEQGVTWMRHASYFRHLSPELAGFLNETYAFLLVPQVMRTMLHYPRAMETLWDAMSEGVLIGRTSEPLFMMKYEPILHLPVEEARKVLGYRNVVDRDVREIANDWAEGIKSPLDPRFGEDLPLAAE